MMDLENIKTKAKGFWHEHKDEIINAGISIGAGFVVGKVICWKLDSVEFNKLRKKTGGNYEHLKYLADVISKSKGYTQLAEDSRGISLNNLCDEGIPQLKELCSRDRVVEDCVIFFRD